jgi:hypothetical protein
MIAMPLQSVFYVEASQLNSCYKGSVGGSPPLLPHIAALGYSVNLILDTAMAALDSYYQFNKQGQKASTRHISGELPKARPPLTYGPI